MDLNDQVHLSANTFKNLLASLKDLELNDIVNQLQNNIIDNNYKNGTERPETPTTENSDCLSFDNSDDDSSREDNFHEKLQVVTEPLVINVKKATKFRDRPVTHMGVYPMRSNPRGLVLIIANNLYKKQNDRRPGAKHDEANLKLLFEEMGFKVITYFDLTGEEIDNRIEEFSQMPELRRVDCAFIIISSHGFGKVGMQETEILGVDYATKGYKKVVCTEIINYFTANNCSHLKGKPKIFIFQTCRGENEQFAVPRYTIDAATTSKPKVEGQYVHFSDTLRDHEDMLIVYSTIPGYVSYRDQYNGSWFIQILCEVFMNHAHKEHLQELFLMIDYRLKNMRTPYGNCQTPSITIRGFNKCFLNPGLFVNKQLNEGDKKEEVMFKCCPDRRANINVCFQCESVYHYKCAKKLGKVKILGKVKADCCSTNNEESENKSLSENVEELKNVLHELREENQYLKEQMSTLQTQHVNIISSEISLKNSEQNLKLENLTNENELLKQLNKEMNDNNQLLREKNDYLSKKLDKKKNHWVKKNLGKVLKRRRQRTTNTIEPIEM